MPTTHHQLPLTFRGIVILVGKMTRRFKLAGAALVVFAFGSQSNAQTTPDWHLVGGYGDSLMFVDSAHVIKSGSSTIAWTLDTYSNPQVDSDGKRFQYLIAKMEFDCEKIAFRVRSMTEYMEDGLKAADYTYEVEYERAIPLTFGGDIINAVCSATYLRKEEFNSLPNARKFARRFFDAETVRHSNPTGN